MSPEKVTVHGDTSLRPICFLLRFAFYCAANDVVDNVQNYLRIQAYCNPISSSNCNGNWCSLFIVRYLLGDREGASQNKVIIDCRLRPLCCHLIRLREVDPCVRDSEARDQ